MTTIAPQARPRPACESPVLGRICAPDRIWAHAVAAYWDRRAAIKALRQLDDRELRDIGLCAQPDRGRCGLAATLIRISATSCAEGPCGHGVRSAIEPADREQCRSVHEMAGR